MTVRDEFLFIGGHPAIDFVNTEVVREGEPLDLLTDAAALERWLQYAGFGRMRVTPAMFKDAKRLRAALRKIVVTYVIPSVARDLGGGGSKSIPGAPPAQVPRYARDDIRTINEELKRGEGALVLRAHDGRFAVEFEPREKDPRFVLARAAAEFLASADPARIRSCGGTNCVLFFYDTTKSGTRRWCSMAGCGNRMKAALHYQRRKDEG